MKTYANVSTVPLSLAVFLAVDNYDHDDATISATTLIKPLRQIVLSKRVNNDGASIDLIQMIPSRMGSAIHDGIERAWVDNYASAMETLGHPQKIIDRIRINPKPEQLTDGIIPIYLEQRAQKQVGKYSVSGKFDFVGDGRVEDFKTTSTYTAMNNTNDEKYILQGSIYRWLNPEIVTQDVMAIQFIFTDWSAARARAESNYPQSRIQQRILHLMSIPETDRYVRNKLNQIDEYWDAPEESIPLCSDDDLWRSAPVFKYYKNPEKTTRSTKNFDTKQEAYIRLAEEGGKGLVLEKPGQVTACKYCPAFAACSQKDALIAQGDLLM
jgi:hypothetical protein